MQMVGGNMTYFEKLYTQKYDEIIIEAPIQIMESAIIKDTVDNVIYLRNIFTNVSKDTIIAIVIEGVLYDITGEIIENNFKYTYQDVIVRSNDLFGNKTPIILPGNVRKINIFIKKVVYQSGDVIDYSVFSKCTPESPEYIEMPQEFLQSLDKNNYSPTVYPVLAEKYWQCTCGRINWKNDSICGLCERSLESQFKFEKNELSLKHKVYVEEQKRKQYEKEIKEIEIKKEEHRKKQEEIRNEQELRKKQLEIRKKRIVFIAVLFIVIISLSSFLINRTIKNKRNQRLNDVKNAIDIVDDSLSEIDDIKIVDTPILYGSDECIEKQKELVEILDKLSENKEIVDNEIKNEDKDFNEQIQKYIESKKKHNNWKQYCSEIDQIFKKSKSSEQVADNIMQDISLTEEEYHDYSNNYFCLRKWDGEKLINFDFEDSDYHFYDYSVDGDPGKYTYSINPFMVAYYGNDHPKDFKATFQLVDSRGKVLSETEWSLVSLKDDKLLSVHRMNGDEVEYSVVKKNGLEYGDYFPVLLHFHSDTKDDPTDIIMNISSE